MLYKYFLLIVSSQQTLLAMYFYVYSRSQNESCFADDCKANRFGVVCSRHHVHTWHIHCFLIHITDIFPLGMYTTWYWDDRISINSPSMLKLSHCRQHCSAVSIITQNLWLLWLLWYPINNCYVTDLCIEVYFITIVYMFVYWGSM